MENVDEAETKPSLMIYTGSNFEKLERNVLCEADEFNRKIEIGRQLKPKNGSMYKHIDHTGIHPEYEQI